MSRSRGTSPHQQHQPPAQNSGKPTPQQGELPPGLTRLDQGIPPEIAAAMRAEAEAKRELRDLLTSDPVAFIEKLPGMFAPVLAQIVAEGVARALAATPVRTSGRVCGTCLALRFAWNALHRADLERAQEQVMAAIGTADPSDPRVQQADATPYLPAHLRTGGGPDGMPVIYDTITTVNGNEVCPQHHPAVQQTGGGRLIAMAGVSVHQAAQFARAMPGALG